MSWNASILFGVCLCLSFTASNRWRSCPPKKKKRITPKSVLFHPRMCVNCPPPLLSLLHTHFPSPEELSSCPFLADASFFMGIFAPLPSMKGRPRQMLRTAVVDICAPWSRRRGSSKTACSDKGPGCPIRQQTRGVSGARLSPLACSSSSWTTTPCPRRQRAPRAAIEPRRTRAP